MEDFLKFRKMFTPVIIQILFWIGVGVSVIAGLVQIGTAFSRYGSAVSVLTGLLTSCQGLIRRENFPSYFARVLV